MNISTFLILLVLIIIISSIIYFQIKNKREGKNNCGSNCSGCALNKTCHSDNKNNNSF